MISKNLPFFASLLFFGISILNFFERYLPEILSLSHRIIVMREGKITKILNNEEATQENIMSYAIN